MSDDTLPPLRQFVALFNREEMRAYGRACADAAIERCALVAEPMDYSTDNATATAIRALKGKPA